jgi:TP901 family phage tail tape measure protein
MPRKVAYTVVLRNQFSKAARKIASSTRAMQRTFAKTGPAAKKMGRQVSSAFGRIKRAAVGLQTTLAPLMLGFTGIAGIVKGVAIGSTFEDSLADLSSIVGVTGKDLAFLKEEAMRLGAQGKISSAEVAQSFKLIASAKSELIKSPEALSKITESAILLKNATGMDLKRSTDAVTESLNQFAAGAERADEFVNILAAGAKIGASEVADTQLAIRNSGVVARQAGLEYSELNAVIQVLAKNGIKGGKAGNQLKGAMLGLEGSSNKRLRPSVVGLNAALEELARLKLSNIQLEKLFGRENISSGSIMANNNVLIEHWGSALKGTRIAEEQAMIRLGTMSAKMRGLGVVIQNKVIRIYDDLRPSLEEAAIAFGDWLNTIEKADLIAIAGGIKDIAYALREVYDVGKGIGGLTAFPMIEWTASMGRYGVAGMRDVGQFFTTGLTDENSNVMKRWRERTQIDINLLNDSAGIVDSIKMNTRATSPGLVVGMNMVG